MRALGSLLRRFERLIFLLFLGDFAWGFPILKHQLSDFYDQVHTQSLSRDFVRFRTRLLISHDAYKMILDPEQKAQLIHHLVLVRGKIERFIYLSEFRGVGIASNQGVYLRFDVRYFETLKDVGIGGDFVAMCVLPRYDKCLLLGYEAF